MCPFCGSPEARSARSRLGFGVVPGVSQCTNPLCGGLFGKLPYAMQGQLIEVQADLFSGAVKCGKVQNTLTLWNVEGYPINVTLLDMGRVVGVLHGRVAPDGIYTPD